MRSPVVGDRKDHENGATRRKDGALGWRDGKARREPRPFAPPSRRRGPRPAGRSGDSRGPQARAAGRQDIRRKGARQAGDAGAGKGRSSPPSRPASGRRRSRGSSASRAPGSTRRAVYGDSFGPVPPLARPGRRRAGRHRTRPPVSGRLTATTPSAARSPAPATRWTSTSSPCEARTGISPDRLAHQRRHDAAQRRAPLPGAAHGGRPVPPGEGPVAHPTDLPLLQRRDPRPRLLLLPRAGPPEGTGRPMRRRWRQHRMARPDPRPRPPARGHHREARQAHHHPHPCRGPGKGPRVMLSAARPVARECLRGSMRRSCQRCAGRRRGVAPWSSRRHSPRSRPGAGRG